MKTILYTTYYPPDVLNHGDSFEESLEKMGEMLTNFDGNFHTF